MKATKFLNKVRRNTEIKPTRQPETNEDPLGRKLGLITRIIGCSHRELGRPFVDGKTSYRSCLKCGARRRFNPETFETYGSFYLPPVDQLRP